METKIESKVGNTQLPAARLYAFFSDLSTLNEFKDRLPADKVSEWNATPDQLSCVVGGMTRITLKVVERQPEAVKMEGEGMGTPFFFWAQIKPLASGGSCLKLTVKSELNFALKMMLEKPIREGLDKLVDTISAIEV